MRKLREADAMLAAGWSVAEVVQALGVTDVFVIRAVPKHIRNTGGEFIAAAIRRVAELTGMEMLYIAPPSPRELVRRELTLAIS